MPAKIIDGKLISEKLKKSIVKDVKDFHKSYARKPSLAVILVGEDAASAVYVKNKVLSCNEVGILSRSYHLDKNIVEDELLELIKTLNGDGTVDGILVQMPLPNQINSKVVIDAIDPLKDVDGFSNLQTGKLMQGEDCLAPCTPTGCIDLIKSTGTNIDGKHAVVVGRSNIVGKPVAMLLLKENATVTICHSKTKDLATVCKKADILIAAVGVKGMIKSDMIKKGAVVIDVGINRFEGKLYGDVEFDTAKNKASFITPVPGGVGPMTIAYLLANTVKAARLREIQ